MKHCCKPCSPILLLGFGLLESGSVTTKNEVNIMVKNAVDVMIGGLSYMIFGYGFSFGKNSPEFTNAFSGWGNFFLMCDSGDIGRIYPKFFFQASFSTTATTIVSGMFFSDITKKNI